MRQRLPLELRRLGNRLREMRQARGLTMEEAAQRIGFTTRTLSRIENGKHPPAFSSLIAIALTYGVTLRDLFSD